MKKILFIIGTTNQTQMMHKIAKILLNDFDCYFSTFYGDGLFRFLSEKGFVDNSLAGRVIQKQNQEFCAQYNYQYDYRGEKHDYDLVITCQDVVIPKNIKNKKIILVQEGTTTPKGLLYKMVKTLKLPRYFADTAMTGLSDEYSYFCVASEGYKKAFASRGADSRKLIVTGIPNFDDIEKYKSNNFPHKNFILIATTNLRESYQYENRVKFLKNALEISKGEKVIFKLHPLENHQRAEREIRRYFPDALIFKEEKIEEMIANCSALITPFSTVVLVAAALNKKIHCKYSEEEINQLRPVQNGGTSAKTIADLARELIEKQ